MSTEITGLSGHANASMQKLSKTATIESFPENKYEAENLSIEEATSSIMTMAQIMETATSLANHSAVDNERIEQIKQAIREGTYRIDPERIADKLIALERTLSE